jgi:hypothetical protein
MIIRGFGNPADGGVVDQYIRTGLCLWNGCQGREG